MNYRAETSFTMNRFSICNSLYVYVTTPYWLLTKEKTKWHHLSTAMQPEIIDKQECPRSRIPLALPSSIFTLSIKPTSHKMWYFVELFWRITLPVWSDRVGSWFDQSRKYLKTPVWQNITVKLWYFVELVNYKSHGKSAICSIATRRYR